MVGQKLIQWQEYEFDEDDDRDRTFRHCWSLAVLHRDGFKCVMCKTDKNLTAHHIRPKKQYPDLKYVFSNAVTLCGSCHNKTHGFDSLHKFS